MKLKRLLPFIPAVTRGYTEPTHLAPLTQIFERMAAGEEVRAYVHTPPRHRKTDTALHGIAWELKQNPRLRFCYVTFAASLADKKSRLFHAIAQRARVPLDPNAQALHDRRTGHDEGGVSFTSTGGAIVGEGFNRIICDDLVKDRVAAESQLARDRVYDYVQDLEARGEPGFSILGFGHRWHQDDWGGRVVASGWEEHRLPAIDDEGRALDPSRFSLDRLLAIKERIGEYSWCSLYQGLPMPRGGRLFADVEHYDTLPEKLSIGIGVDFAYTIATHSDWSVAVVLGSDGERYYVIDVVRLQVTAPTFRASLEALRGQYPKAPMTAYVGGTERAVIDLFAENGIVIDGRAAVADKFTRAQPASAAWNAKKILVPHTGRWLDAFVTEVCGFTGVGDRNDDQVDALAAAFAGCGAGHDTAATSRGLAYSAQRQRTQNEFGKGRWRGTGRGTFGM